MDTTEYRDLIDRLAERQPHVGYSASNLPLLTDAEHALVLRSDPDIVSDTDCPPTMLVAAALDAYTADEKATAALALVYYFRSATHRSVRRRLLADVVDRCEELEMMSEAVS